MTRTGARPPDSRGVGCEICMEGVRVEDDVTVHPMFVLPVDVRTRISGPPGFVRRSAGPSGNVVRDVKPSRSTGAASR